MFKELYYWMYANLRNVKNNENPAQNAFFLICILQIFNIGTIGVIIIYIFKIILSKEATVSISLALAFVVMIINYLLIYSKREIIFNDYEILPLKRKTKGKVYFWLYVVFSLIIFFVLVANLVTPRF